MGDLVLSDFVSEIQSGMGNRTELSADRITTVLNMAQKRLARRWPWKDLKKLILAQMSFTGNPAVDKYVSLPPNVRTIHSFVLLDTSAGVASMGQSKKVTQKPWRWFDKRYPAVEWLPPGWPSVYAWWGQFLVVVPVPQQQYTAELRVTMQPAPFNSAVTNQESMYTDKDDILINWSLGYLHRSYGRLDRAVYHENLVNELVAEAIEQDDRQPDLDISHDLDRLDTGSTSIMYWNNPWVMTQP